jgi:predicted CXXCH cytochrome family protein
LLFVSSITLMVADCNERIVFRDRELFDTPQAAAANFLGYSDTARSLPVCGHCHVGPNSEWKETAHAEAWMTLVRSGAQQAACEGCHTVNALGNPATGNAGWAAVQDARYHDVQCESCHGPGLTHVQDPDAETKPLAPLRVDTAISVGCGECHTGRHQPFVEEWRKSGHGRVQTSPAGRAECQECHTGEDALRVWGINVDYLEKDSVNASATAHLPITCAVCHDPHSADNPGQLRFPVDVPSEGGNLCMKCHHKRGTPDETTFRGPHSPEGPVLLGYGGWWPPNLEIPGDTVFATHGSDRNPKLCAGCHLVRFTVTDPQSGNFQFQATGHLFHATPCLDAQGIPQPGTCPETQRTYRTCTGAGCHGSENVARSLEATAEQRIAALAATLDATLAKIHVNWKTCRNNNQCGAGSPFNSADGKFTTAEGAAFNYDLAVYPGSVIHNPFLIEALLTASIAQVREDYNVTVPPGIDLRNILSGR